MPTHESHSHSRVPRVVRQRASAASATSESHSSSDDKTWTIIAACVFGMMLLAVVVWFLSHRDGSQSDAVNAAQQSKPAIVNPPAVANTTVAAEQYIEVDTGVSPPMSARSPVPGAGSYKNLHVGSEQNGIERQRVKTDDERVQLDGKWSKIFREGKSSAATEEDPAIGAVIQTSHIGPGFPAPEIVGKDSQSVQFRLSDYRGKVVLLHFWSGKCQTCRSLISHQPRLVKKFDKDPFMIVGVNIDEPGKSTLHKTAKVRDFVANSTQAAHEKWNVPCSTLFLIDAEGIIRMKFDGFYDYKTFDFAVGDLLEKMSNNRSGRSRTAG